MEKLSVVFVTHSSYEAAFLADRIILMKAQGGELILNENVSYTQSRGDALRASSEYQTMVANITSISATISSTLQVNT
jgi:ABC-type nitrate/sulfonate/bicarbonate transport system ATPase subunit